MTPPGRIVSVALLVFCAPARAEVTHTITATVQAGGAFLRGAGGKHDAAWLQKARLSAVWEKQESWRLEAAAEVAALEGAGTGRKTAGPAAPVHRGDDLNPFPILENGFSGRANLDRLNLRRDLGDWELTVGRQAIGHGNGRYFNPSDLLAPLSPFGINTEYKAGVDAIKLERPLNDAQDVGLWLVTHRRGWQEGASLLRWRKSGETLDLSMLAGVMAREPTVGWDLSGQAGGAAWYTEGVASFGRGRKDRARLSGGWHLVKPSGLQALVEWQHNTAGAAGAWGALRVTGEREWQDGQIFLAGRWHAAVLLSDDYQPLKSWTFLAVHDFSAGSWLLSPGLGFDLSETRQLRVGLQTGWGKNALRLPGGAALPRSEFGDTPTTVYVEWLWSR